LTTFNARTTRWTIAVLAVIVALLVALLVAPSAVRADEPGKVLKIGVVYDLTGPAKH